MNIRKMYISITIIVLTTGFSAPAAPYDNNHKDGRIGVVKKSQSAQQPDYFVTRDPMRALKVLAGNWSFESRLFQSPGGAPELMRGTVSFDYILDGSLLEGHYGGTISNSSFEGLFTIGYDLNARQYFATWRHSYDAHLQEMFTGQANLDANGDLKDLVLSSTCQNCQPGCSIRSTSMTCTYTLSVVNINTLFVKMQTTDDQGNLFTSEESNYTRLQSPASPIKSGVR